MRIRSLLDLTETQPEEKFAANRVRGKVGIEKFNILLTFPIPRCFFVLGWKYTFGSSTTPNTLHMSDRFLGVMLSFKLSKVTSFSIGSPT